jgi:hypothetical protein
MRAGMTPPGSFTIKMEWRFMKPIPAEPILLAVDDACRTLGGISRRTLWTLTNRAENRIPHVKLGARVMYPRHDLLEWVAYQKTDSISAS